MFFVCPLYLSMSNPYFLWFFKFEYAETFPIDIDDIIGVLCIKQCLSNIDAPCAYPLRRVHRTLAANISTFSVLRALPRISSITRAVLNAGMDAQRREYRECHSSADRSTDWLLNVQITSYRPKSPFYWIPRNPITSKRTKTKRRSSGKITKSNGDEQKQSDSESGCDWTGSLGDYERGAHLCSLDVVSCPHCNEEVLRNHIHTKCEQCSADYVQCQGHSCSQANCICDVMQHTKRSIFSMFFWLIIVHPINIHKLIFLYSVTTVYQHIDIDVCWLPGNPCFRSSEVTNSCFSA